MEGVPGWEQVIGYLFTRPIRLFDCSIIDLLDPGNNKWSFASSTASSFMLNSIFIFTFLLRKLPKSVPSAINHVAEIRIQKTDLQAAVFDLVVLVAVFSSRVQGHKCQQHESLCQ